MTSPILRTPRPQKLTTSWVISGQSAAGPRQMFSCSTSKRTAETSVRKRCNSGCLYGVRRLWLQRGYVLGCIATSLSSRRTCRIKVSQRIRYGLPNLALHHGLPRPHRGLRSSHGNAASWAASMVSRSEEHTSELQSLRHLVCRLLLEKKNTAYSRSDLYSSPKSVAKSPATDLAQ